MTKDLPHALGVLALIALSGCDMIKSQVCVGSSQKSVSQEDAVGPQGDEASETEVNRFLYTRAKYFPNPTTRKDGVPVLHMCWYLAESEVAFATPSAFEIGIQTDPSVAKITSLYEFYTPTSILAANMKKLNESGSGDLDKSGIARLTLVMGDLDRIALGLGNLVHSAPAGLVALSYFSGDFAQLNNDNANLSKRAIASQLPETSKTPSPPNTPSAKTARAANGDLQSLSPMAIEMLDKNLRAWGTNAPPEEILRLPIEVLVEFSCPAY